MSHDPAEVRAAERSVVGELIFNPARVREAAAVVFPDDFADLALGSLYGLIAAMVSANGPKSVSGLTITQEVKRKVAEARAEAADKGHRGVFRTYPDMGEIATLATTVVSGDLSHHCRIVREASVLRRIGTLGGWLMQQSMEGADPAGVTTKLVERALAIRDDHRANAAPRTLADVLADTDADEYEWVIPGLLERGDRLILTGEEGKGKTTFLRQIITCAAGGTHPFTGGKIEPIKALVIDCENSERQWRRSVRGLVTAVSRRSPIDPTEAITLACVARMDITSSAAQGMIHALCDEVEPDLVMIGPLYRLYPKAINNDDDAAPVLAALDSIRDRPGKPALMMEAHPGLSRSGASGERDMRPRGSSALLGWPEVGLGLLEDSEIEGRSKLVRWRGDREERQFPAAVRRGGALPWTDDRVPPAWSPSGVLGQQAS